MSDNIFAEIYNRILSLFGQNVKDESKNTAVNRLRLVLMQDRTNLTPEIMNRMRSELIGVLSKYVELDKEALDLNIGQEGEQMALMLSIPVIRAKDEAEIEQAIKEEEEAKKAKENSENKEESEENTEKETESSEDSEEEVSSEEESADSEPSEDKSEDDSNISDDESEETEEKEIQEAPETKDEPKLEPETETKKTEAKSEKTKKEEK